MLRLFGKVSRRLRAVLQRSRMLPEVPSIHHNTFLFVGGLHRSGTSILHRVLREHASTSGFKNTGVPEDEGQHLQTVFPPAKQYGGLGRFAFEPAAHMDESSQLLSASNRDRLLREWGAHYHLGKKVLLEKSPPNVVRSRFFQAMFPTAKFAFIVRHPAVVALATERMSGRPESIVEMLLHWHIAHKILLYDAKSLREKIIFRYEDFVDSPISYLDRICELVGIDTFALRQEIADRSQKYFTKWVADCANERLLLERAFPGVIEFYEQFGYSLTPPFVKPLRNGRFVDTNDV